MNREFIRRLSKAYGNAGLSLSEAVNVWAKEGMTIDAVQKQIFSDVGIEVAEKSAEYLVKTGCGTPSYSEIVNSKRPFDADKKKKTPEMSTREPEMVKLNSKTRNDVIKVGNQLYRSKSAKKYWALKEKVGENGKKELYLVAIEDAENKR